VHGTRPCGGESACDSVGADRILIRGGRHGGAVYRAGVFRRSTPPKGGVDLLRRLRGRRTVCLKRLGDGHASEVRLWRFLNSPHVTAAEMLATEDGAGKENRNVSPPLDGTLMGRGGGWGERSGEMASSKARRLRERPIIGEFRLARS
jgi:hypothetical protein